MYGRLQRNQRNETRVLRSRWTALSFFAAFACLTIQLPNHAVAQHSHGVLTPGVTFPTDDSVLDESPQMIMMSFRVDVTLLKLALYTAEGQWINIGFSYDPNRMADSFAYPLGFELPDSEYYIARWSVTDESAAYLMANLNFRSVTRQYALPKLSPAK